MKAYYVLLFLACICLGVRADCSISGYGAFNCTNDVLYFSDLRISSAFDVGLQTARFTGNNFTLANGSAILFNFILPSTFGQIQLEDQEFWLNYEEATFNVTVDASYLANATLQPRTLQTFSARLVTWLNYGIVPFTTVIENIPPKVSCYAVSTFYDYDGDDYGPFGIDVRCWITIEPLFVFIRIVGAVPSSDQLEKLERYLQDSLGAGPRLTVEVSETFEDGYVLKVTIATPYLYQLTSEEIQQELLKRLNEDVDFITTLKNYLPPQSNITGSSDNREGLASSPGNTFTLHLTELILLALTTAVLSL